MAKKRKQQKIQVSLKALVKKNKLLLFAAVAVVLGLFLYLTSQQAPVTEETTEKAISLEESAALQAITGETQFGYMKEGYLINVEVKGKTRQIYINSLNDDGTVDITMNRAYNVEVGEKVYADYDNDGYADIAFTLDGVELYANRFSMTLTYYGGLPDTITAELAGTDQCIDTDGGKNYEVKGEVSDIESAHDTDRCSKSDVYPGRLYEAYCADDGTHARDVYDCPSGMCSDGVCVAE